MSRACDFKEGTSRIIPPVYDVPPSTVAGVDRRLEVTVQGPGGRLEARWDGLYSVVHRGRDGIVLELLDCGCFQRGSERVEDCM